MDKGEERNCRPEHRDWQYLNSHVYPVNTDVTDLFDRIRIDEGWLYRSIVMLGATPTAAMVFVPAVHAPQSDMEAIHG